jgi:REP element-mobilizing transposase RayT
MSVHLVFSTKNRQPQIERDWTARLYSYIGGIARETKTVLLHAGGMADHVHLLVSMGREISLARLTRLIKANSSRWIHQSFPSSGEFAWQSGYGGFSVSHSQTATVKRYLDRQEEHHRDRSFQDEFRALLRKHGIEFDERFLWD